MAQPRTVNRPALLMPLVVLFTAGGLQANLLLEENFSYSTGQLTAYGGGANVSGGNWVGFSGSGNYIPVTSGSLSYSGYPSSGTGNLIHIISATGSAEDAYRLFTTQPPGSVVYGSFLLNLTNLTGIPAATDTIGDYFASLQPGSSTTYTIRISIRNSATPGFYVMGMRASGAPGNPGAVWHSLNMSPGTTYLIAFRYAAVPGLLNDTASMWINPSLAGAEPAPDLVQVPTAGSDTSGIGRIAIRQGYSSGPPTIATPNADIDGIRVGTAWGDISGIAPPNPSVSSTKPASNAVNVLPTATIRATFNKLIKASTVDTLSFTITGRRQAVYSADSIRPLSNSASYTFYVKDSLRTLDTVTVTLSTAIQDTGNMPMLSNYTWKFYTLVPETLKPYLVSSNPANGASRIMINDDIILTFNEMMHPASVDTGAIELLGRKRGKYPINPPVLSRGDTVLTVTPMDTLYYGDTVTVHVKPALTDLSGNGIRDTSVTFYTRSRPGLPIYDIQYSPTGTSPYAGQVVTVTGVVTSGSVANAGRSYYIQDETGPWNGIYVYDGAHIVDVGDSVKVTGKIVEFARTGYTGTTTEFSPVNDFVLLKRNCTLPAPAVVPTCSLATSSSTAEAYEGVLIETRKVVVTNASLGFGEWAISDGSGPCRVDDQATYNAYHYRPYAGDSIEWVRGVLCFDYGDFKIEPRYVGDVLCNSTPKTVFTYPTQGDTSVPTSLAISIGFNKPMNRSSFTPANFRLTGCRTGDVPFSVSYDTTTWTAYLIPAQYFMLAETIAVHISHLISDTTGRTLDGNNNQVSQPDSTDDINFRFFTLRNVMSIGEVQRPGPDGYGSVYAGQNVLVQGILTGPAQYFSSTTWSSSASMYIQDNTSGVNVFAGSITMSDPRISKLGQLCVVLGQVTEYNGVTEITTDTAKMRFWGLAPVLPKTDTLIYNQFLTEDMEGKLMEVEGTISSPPAYAGGGYNMELRNGDAPIAARFSEISRFPLNQLTLGKKVHLVGVVGQYDKTAPYDGGYQIIPRFAAPYTYGGVQYPADITIVVDTVAALAASQIVSCRPNPFGPDLGEVMRIDLNGPVTDHLTLRLYDLKGRLVKTLLNNVLGGHQVCYWDGTNDGHRRANIGMYVLHLRSVSTDGTTRNKSMVVVLGTPLK